MKIFTFIMSISLKHDETFILTFRIINQYFNVHYCYLPFYVLSIISFIMLKIDEQRCQMVIHHYKSVTNVTAYYILLHIRTCAKRCAKNVQPFFIAVVCGVSVDYTPLLICAKVWSHEQTCSVLRKRKVHYELERRE